MARRAGESDAKVLITGESGVGKDVVAREIHGSSRRAARPYVAVNCAGFPEGLLETELFGHRRGSFTGAERDRPGKIQSADGGTLFLDEVGEMSLRMQATLLRFLENGEIQTVGDRGPSRVDVRIVAATNRNLPERVSAGEFRQDLLYRLMVVQITVPPLRQRPEDIPALVEHFLRRAPRPMTCSEEARRALSRYRWPGNVRELQNVIEQAIWLTSGSEITLACLPEAVRTSAQGPVSSRERRRQVGDQLFEYLVQHKVSFWDYVYPLFMQRDVTRHDIRVLVGRALAETRGNYRAALRLFGMPDSDYNRFHNFLSAHGCKVEFRNYRTGVKLPSPRRPDLPAVPPAATGV